MTHTKTIKIPATKESKIVVNDYTSCDLCGKKIDEHPCEIDEVTVRRRTGAGYPENVGGRETSVDMCSDCFNEKLIPWLISQGAEPAKGIWGH